MSSELIIFKYRQLMHRTWSVEWKLVENVGNRGLYKMCAPKWILFFYCRDTHFFISANNDEVTVKREVTQRGVTGQSECNFKSYGVLNTMDKVVKDWDIFLRSSRCSLLGCMFSVADFRVSPFSPSLLKALEFH